MFFFKHDVPICGTHLVDVLNVNEQDFEAPDIYEIILIRFLLKIGYKTCAYVFLKHDIPTCGTQPS